MAVVAPLRDERGAALHAPHAPQAPHPLHASERVWGESNCYVDLWIELLHARGQDPLACFGFTVAMDFEGDHWSFFKPPLGDLERLYGIVVEELNLWRALELHLAEQIRRGRLAIIEVDAFYLPDTRGTTYHAEHSKTSIAVTAIDPAARRMDYFHNAGTFTLNGYDFSGIFRHDVLPGSAQLPPYAEMVKLDVLPALTGHSLTEAALERLNTHFTRRPRTNPIAAYRERFAADIEMLQAGEREAFHRYAFANLRQLGASHEIGASFLDWLEARGQTDFAAAAVDFNAIAQHAKALQFKLARTVNTGKPFDIGAAFTPMIDAWDRATERLGSTRAGQECAENP